MYVHIYLSQMPQCSVGTLTSCDILPNKCTYVYMYICIYIYICILYMYTSIYFEYRSAASEPYLLAPSAAETQQHCRADV